MVVNCLVKQSWLGRYIVLWKRDCIMNRKRRLDGNHQVSSLTFFQEKEDTVREESVKENKVDAKTPSSQQLFGLTSFQRKIFQEYIAAMNEDCGDLMSLFKPMLPVVVLLSTCFIAFFLFDMLGDQVEALNAVWILVIMATMPIWVRIGKYIVCKLYEMTTTVSGRTE